MQQRLQRLDKPLAVEELIVEVSPSAVDRWIELDHEIWSNGLAQWPGYAGKQIRQSSRKPGRLHIVIYWEDYDAWKAIDLAWLEAVEKEFDERFLPEKAVITAAPHEVEQFFLIAESSSAGDVP